MLHDRYPSEDRPCSRMFVTDDFTAIFMPIERRRSFIPSVPLQPQREPLSGFANAIIGARSAWFNVSTRRVGGLRFIKIGRLCLSFCITRTYSNLNK